MIPILILAGGASSRMMGRDKLLETIGGQPLLRLLAERATDTGHSVFVALRPDDVTRAAVLDGLHVTPIVTPAAAEGMSGTMREAVAALPDCPAFMLLLADLPDITTSDMQTILAARIAQPDHVIWRGATTTGKPGHPIVFDASLRPQFAKLSGDGGGETLVQPLRDRTHLTRFDTDRARLDLDTPADWAAWRAKALE